MKKINFKKQASKMLFKAKKQARKPFGSADGVKKNAAKMSNKMTAPEKAFCPKASKNGRHAGRIHPRYGPVCGRRPTHHH